MDQNSLPYVYLISKVKREKWSIILRILCLSLEKGWGARICISGRTILSSRLIHVMSPETIQGGRLWIFARFISKLPGDMHLIKSFRVCASFFPPDSVLWMSKTNMLWCGVGSGFRYCELIRTFNRRDNRNSKKWMHISHFLTDWIKLHLVFLRALERTLADGCFFCHRMHVIFSCSSFCKTHLSPVQLNQIS